MTLARQRFLEIVLAQEGKPYIWTAKGPDAFDCSGLVTFGLKGAGYSDHVSLFAPTELKGITDKNWQLFCNAHRLYSHLSRTDAPQAGDLAFYGMRKMSGSQATHIVVYMGPDDKRIIGANGGGSGTTSAIIAAKQGAKVKFKPSHLYRPDFLGFRVLPL